MLAFSCGPDVTGGERAAVEDDPAMALPPRRMRWLLPTRTTSWWRATAGPGWDQPGSSRPTCSKLPWDGRGIRLPRAHRPPRHRSGVGSPARVGDTHGRRPLATPGSRRHRHGSGPAVLRWTASARSAIGRLPGSRRRSGMIVGDQHGEEDAFCGAVPFRPPVVCRAGTSGESSPDRRHHRAGSCLRGHAARGRPHRRHGR